MHDQGHGIFIAGLGLGHREVKHRLGLRIHRPRHVEARQGQARRCLLGRRGRRHRIDQLVATLGEFGRLVLPPLAVVEDRTDRRGRALGANVRRRQRQPARPRQRHRIRRDVGDHVVGIGPDHHALHRFKHRQFDEALALDEPLRRRQRRHHQQRVAGVGIGHAVQASRTRDRNGDIGALGVIDVPPRDQRLRGLLERLGKRQRPVCAGVVCGRPLLTDQARRQRDQLRLRQPHTDRLPFRQRHHTDIADYRTSIAANRLEVDRLRRIEHQPQRVGAPEQRHRCRHRESEIQPHAIAAARDADRRTGIVIGFGGSVAGPKRRGWPGGEIERLHRRHGRCGCRGTRNRRRCRLRRHRLGGGNARDLAFRDTRRRRSLSGLLRRGIRLAMLLRRRSDRRLRRWLWGNDRQDLRAFRRPETDIDHIVLIFAERMHVDVADQPDFDLGRVAFDLLVDAADTGRRDQLGVSEIECQRRVEHQ